MAEFIEEMEAAAARDVGSVARVLLGRVTDDDAWNELPPEIQEMFVGNGPAIVAEIHGGELDATPEQLGGIMHPTLLVAGEETDAAHREMTEIMAAAMPHARVAWVPGDHLISPTEPPVVAFVDEVLAR